MSDNIKNKFNYEGFVRKFLISQIEFRNNNGCYENSNDYVAERILIDEMKPKELLKQFDGTIKALKIIEKSYKEKLSEVKNND